LNRGRCCGFHCLGAVPCASIKVPALLAYDANGSRAKAELHRCQRCNDVSTDKKDFLMDSELKNAGGHALPGDVNCELL
jgi:hypothetical protein